MIDFLIIGGGIAGLSAAAKLSHFGKTTVVEAETATGYHASGRSAAMYLKDYGNQAVRTLNYASQDELEDAAVLKQRGILIPSSQAERGVFEGQMADFQMMEISKSDALHLCPILNSDVLAYAAFRPDGFDLDTDLLMQRYIKTAKANGAEIVTDCRVDQIEKTKAGWRVEAGATSFDTRIVINAAGAWVDQIATLAGLGPLGFQPYRRSFARLPAPGGHMVNDWPFMIGVGDAWYAKPDAGKWLVSPGEKDPMDPFDAYADDMVLAEGIARYQEIIAEPVTRVEGSWAGLRTFAPDETLVIGRDPREPSFVWLAGQGGYGFQSAPAASDLIAHLIAGRASSIDPAPFAPDRLI